MKLKRREIHRLIEKYKKIFLQRDWDITIHVNEDETWENFATTGVQEGRRAAIMMFWDLLPEKEYEEVVIHEMVHIVLDPMDRLISEWLDELPEEKRLLFAKQWRDRVEVVTENIEKVIVNAKL